VAATVFSAFAAEPAEMVDTKMGKILAHTKGIVWHVAK
jgi:predicted lipoprotein with Yx(FWY)xxD motif